MDQLEALTDAKDWKVNPFLVFLPQHIVPHFLSEFIEVRHFSRLTINQWGCTSCKEDAIDRVEQNLEVIIGKIISDWHSPVASVVDEMNVSLPSKVRILEGVGFHAFVEDGCRNNTDDRLCRLKTIFEVKVGVVFCICLNDHL